jgi:hypothetical protein
MENNSVPNRLLKMWWYNISDAQKRHGSNVEICIAVGLAGKMAHHLFECTSLRVKNACSRHCTGQSTKNICGFDLNEMEK